MASRSRLRHHVVGAVVAASVALPVAGAGPAAVPAPAPPRLAPLNVATPGVLAERYAVVRNGIRAAERMAAIHGDRRRAETLHGMADPARRFLSVDGRNGGRSVEVFGDLATARRVAVLVPGAGVGLDNVHRLRGRATALHRELGDRSAVIAWLGYETPAQVSPQILTTTRADEAAPRLGAFVRELRAAVPDARVSLLCHSYGSLLCARAAPDVNVDALMLYGSPGIGCDTVDGLHTTATVWVGRGARDPVAHVPHVRVGFGDLAVGFGVDPMSREFGARVFDAGPGGHSDYLRPGSVSLANIARIVAGVRHD